MAELSPFRALRFDGQAPRVPGGDRVDTSALVTPDGTRSGETARCQARSPSFSGAVRTLTHWWHEGWIRADDDERLWVLEIVEAGAAGSPRAQEACAGVVGALRLDGDVVAHEDTSAVLVADRVARLRAVPVDLSPIMAYPTEAVGGVTAVVEDARQRAPDLVVHDEVGRRFRLWSLPPAAAVAASLRGARLVVADGHHRVAAARRLAGAGPARSLSFVLPGPPASQAVHRLVRTRDGSDVWRALCGVFEVRAVVAARDELVARLGARHGPAYAVLTPRGDGAIVEPRDPAATDAAIRGDRSSLWRGLDAVRWRYGLRPALGDVQITAMADPEATLALPPAPATDTALVLFRPVETAVVTRLALAGELLPPKVTWFTPKPRTGVFARAAA